MTSLFSVFLTGQNGFQNTLLVYRKRYRAGCRKTLVCTETSGKTDRAGEKDKGSWFEVSEMSNLPLRVPPISLVLPFPLFLQVSPRQPG